MPQFDRGKTIDFASENDNMRSVPTIDNLMFGPLIGHKLESNGII